ncbi:glutathione-dependent formaldehyde-activating enzyme [Colletotrichum tabaci]|uniref:Glutathione-dependent formaldehyde-activating enzyme n=1 Tax=Colletotrichum tabaci TaxID=1209068 RepID=A0AAV9TJA5_9PEZI
MPPISLDISCLCGAVAQQVKSRGSSDAETTELSIGHSDMDRHATGILCASYYPIGEPDVSKGTAAHDGADGWTRFFCLTCGCHVFRRKTAAGQAEWEAATGVLVSSTEDNADGDEDARFTKHTSVSDTKDGGLSVWLPQIDGRALEATTQDADPAAKERAHSSPLPPLSSLVPANTLPASCACGRVSFHITRPDERSQLPHSGFPDLQYAACSHSADFMSNPEKVKWWIRADGTKYLAGTCACRSCRLISGFEIQTWAFVPRENIVFHVPGPDGSSFYSYSSSSSSAGTGTGVIPLPLDFATLPAGILRTYESSPGVLREFCGACGATVFWHDKWRPDVIDVSVGLLRAQEGARAESWLDWWTDRCSFEEETETGRTGEPARIARKLVDGLERGLRSWAQSR